MLGASQADEATRSPSKQTPGQIPPMSVLFLIAVAISLIAYCAAWRLAIAARAKIFMFSLLTILAFFSVLAIQVGGSTPQGAIAVHPEY